VKGLVGAAVSGWLLAGLLGVGSYGNDYYLYRGFPAPKDSPGVAAGRFAQVHFYSAALHQRRSYLVYLPPGYARLALQGKRFPVIYLLHAPPGRPDGYVLAGDLGVRADTLIAAKRIQPFLAVLPYGKNGTLGNDTEWANTKVGSYENFVLDTVRAVDSRWATKPQRAYRAIGGLSEGGYGAANIALHHPGVFSVFESWSGYFEQTPTSPFAGASARTLRANSPSAYLPAIASSIRQLPMHAYLYQGRSDGYPVAKLVRFADELRAAGVRVRYSLHPGGHNWRLWRSEMGPMLTFASQSFGGR
jgi:enterochelin esterase-like enzyme